MTDRQIIRETLGRMAAEAPPAPEFDELFQPVIRTDESMRPRRVGWMAWAGTAAAVVLFVVGAIVVSRPGTDGATPIGVASAASVDEFRSALTAGFNSLAEAEGVEGIEEAYIQGHLASRVWLSGHPGGDAAVVQQANVDVRDTAWWLASANPPAEREQIVTSAWMKLDGVAYEAGFGNTDEAWQVSPSPSTEPPSFALTLLDPTYGPEMRRPLSPPSAEVTRQETINGGTIWLATYPGEGQSRFYIHPDGHLATWTWLNLGPLEVDDRPADSGSVEYTTSDVAPTVTLPAIGSPFDLSQFNVPEDFPIGR